MPRKEKSLNSLNDLKELDAPVHRWWRFVLAYPPHLVSKYIEKFELKKGAIVYDPFSGTGTTLVEAKKLGFKAIGSEAMEFCYVASKVKTNFEISSKKIKSTAAKISKEIEIALSHDDSSSDDIKSSKILKILSNEQVKLMGKDYISPKPLHKLLVIRKIVHQLPAGEILDFFNLALGAVSVSASNVGFGPEIYVRKIKADEDVKKLWDDQVKMMIDDLTTVSDKKYIPSELHHADARDLSFLAKNSIDAVITSPPYPNEKNYLRITRIEHVITDLIKDGVNLKIHKKRLLRSNSGNIYKSDNDGDLVAKFESIQKIANEVEQKRISLNKNSGWEKLYPTVVRHYFGGMYRHLEELLPKLKTGAKCAYVVGDQMSFLMVHIKTGEIIAEMAKDIGYQVDGIDLWRDRWATSSKILLREEVVLLSKR